jgi:hypothetical protein
LGPTGPQGVPGDQGLTGGIGPVGPTGPSGTNGINGTNGTNGSVGPTGPAGPGVTLTAGDGLSGGGVLNANRTISHADTSSQASVNNSDATFIQDITLDTYGHITSIGSATLNTNTLGATRFYNDATLNSSTDTASFISELINDYGCFQNNNVVLKISWSYAGNSDLNTGHHTIGTIELAGCVIETWGGTYKHVRITRPNTGTGEHGIYEYNDQSSSYSPGWREI